MAFVKARLIIDGRLAADLLFLDVLQNYHYAKATAEEKKNY
jgi:hypothetical protein